MRYFFESRPPQSRRSELRASWDSALKSIAYMLSGIPTLIARLLGSADGGMLFSHRTKMSHHRGHESVRRGFPGEGFNVRYHLLCVDTRYAVFLSRFLYSPLHMRTEQTEAIETLLGAIGDVHPVLFLSGLCLSCCSCFLSPSSPSKFPVSSNYSVPDPPFRPIFACR